MIRRVIAKFGNARWLHNGFAIALFLGAAGCDRAPAMIELSGPAQGTTYSVKIAAPPVSIDSHAVRLVIDDVLQKVDLQMSGYRPDSEISRFNQSASTDWFDVSPEFAAVIALSRQVSEQSQGALDVTVAPLVNLWGMGTTGELRQVPADADLERVRNRIGYEKLSLRPRPPALRKAVPDLSIDLNAVAPGYTVDLLAARFLALGIENYMIDLGGEVRAHGRNAQGQPWRIAVERPVNTEPEPYAIVQLENMAVTTSGEYRHFVDRDGHRYSHTIDPRTLRPVEHTLASVVVVSRTAAEADAWATALNVLGAEKGYALALQQGMPVMFIIDNAGKLESRMTPQFQNYIAVAPQ